jgi:filamentous hemagglutinin
VGGTNLSIASMMRGWHQFKYWWHQFKYSLNANGIGAVYREGMTVRGLRELVGVNKPAIVRIMKPEGGHAVVVDSFTRRMGRDVVSIRNPHGVEYYQPLEDFMKVFTGHSVILK